MPSLSYITVALYGLATLAFVTQFFHPHRLLERGGRWLLGLTAGVHVATIGSYCTHGLHPLRDTAGILNLIALLLVVTCLVLGLTSRMAAAAPLILPLAFGLALSGQLTPHGEPVMAVGSATKVLAQLHLTLVALGVAAFALAAAIGLLYLMQDDALRTNRLGLLYRRTPSLTTLDRTGRQLTLIGFPAFTLSVVAGVLWLRRLPQEGFRIEYGISAAVWIVFAGLIAMRMTSGVSGRRAALLTVAAFVATAIVLALYAMRKVVGT